MKEETKKANTIVAKVSESGKTMLVGHKSSKYTVGYEFGWCANPDKLKKGDSIADFEPTGREPMSKDGKPMVHKKDGSPVMRWVF